MSTNDLPKISDQEFANRLQQVRQKMEANGLDLLVLYGNLLDPSHVRYLADVSPINESTAIVLPLEGEAILCSGQANHAWSAFKSKVETVRVLPEVGEVAGTEYEIEGQASFGDLFKEIKEKHAIKRIGTVGTLIFPQIVYQQLTDVFPETEIVNAEPLMYELRVRKSPAELACMRKAATLLDETFTRLLDKVEAGWTELAIQAEIEAGILQGGAEDHTLAWSPMVPSGPDNTQLCMNRNTLRKVKESEMIALAGGACYEGYNAALCYPLVLGQVPAEIKDAVRVGNEAMQAIIERLKPGATSREVNAAGRGVLEKGGYGEYSPYGMVHCIGLLECESPWLPVDKDYEIVEGMGLCIDVFLFGLDWGSFRIENTLAVTGDGVDLLTHFNDQNINRIIQG